MALFREAMMKESRITDAAGMMIEAAAMALSREDVVKDTDVARMMIDAGKATDPDRNTVVVTPVVRITTRKDGAMDMVIPVMVEVVRDTDTVDRNLARAAKPRNSVKVKTSSKPTMTSVVTIRDTAGKWTGSVDPGLC